jgi:hypothetical protein
MVTAAAYAIKWSYESDLTRCCGIKTDHVVYSGFGGGEEELNAFTCILQSARSQVNSRWLIGQQQQRFCWWFFNSYN